MMDGKKKRESRNRSVYYFPIKQGWPGYEKTELCMIGDKTTINGGSEVSIILPFLSVGLYIV